MYNIFPYYEYIGSILVIIVIIVLAYVLTKFSLFIINKLSNRWNLEITFKFLLNDLSKYLIWLIAFVAILEVVGVNVSAIIFSLGIIGVTVGFAARDIISSVIAGIFIIADNTVRVGEVIKVSEVVGRVKKLGFRTTTLVTTDNVIVTIPNSLLSKNAYLSYTYLDEQRIDLEVLIPLKVDLEKFKEIFTKQIYTLEWVLEHSQPKVFVKEIVSDGIVLKISAWASEYSKIEEYRLSLANEVRKLINEIN